MKSLKQVSDLELVVQTKQLVADERKLTAEILCNLREIETRRVFAVRGFSSLHEFCVKELGYSDGAAFRRIQAMRLIVDVPEVKEAILDGALSLTTASTVQNFLNNEKRINKKTYSKEEKLELLTDLKGKSKLECERALAQISPRAMPKERARAISEQETEIKFVASTALVKKLNRIKALASHKLSDKSYAALFEAMADVMLKQIDPEMKKERASRRVKQAPRENLQKTPRDPKAPLEKLATPMLPVTAPPLPARITRYIAAQTKRAVWKRDGGRCTYIDRATMHRCDSTYFLQLDHIRPYAMGGESTVENLRLRCHAHNQLAAMQVYGKEKMQKFIAAG